MKTTLTRKPAFTLVELLVVISIISVLMAILMPALGRARTQAKQTVCSSQMRQLGIAHVMYQQSHDQYVTPATQDNGVEEYWYNTLGSYFNRNHTDHGDDSQDMGTEILCCPEDKLAYPKMLNPHGLNPEGWLSYALNSQPTRSTTSRKQRYAGVGGNKIVCIRNPDRTMLHVDFAYRAWVCDSVTLTQNLFASEPGAHYDTMNGYPEQNETVAEAYRHNGRMNVLWADGHVAPILAIPSALDDKTFWGLVYHQCKSLEP